MPKAQHDTPADSPAIFFDITVEDARWNDVIGREHIEMMSARALAEVFAVLEGPDHQSFIDMRLTDDVEIAKINNQWRGQNKPTNVLSFPAAFMAAPGGDHDWWMPLGDLVLAFDTIAAEAVLDNKPLDHHLTHLIVHGVLHLLGYDHTNDEDAETMEQLERDILARLAIPDPYDI